MPLVSCPECQALISDKSSACVKCGAPRTPAAPPPAPAVDRHGEPVVETPTRLWPWVVGIGGMLGALIYFGGPSLQYSSAPDPREVDGRAIQLCWEDQARKSLAPAEARFVASTCEMMERDYQKKHGRRP